MARLGLATLALMLAAGAALADGYARVDSRAQFLSLVEGRELSRFGIALRVRPDGTIGGNGFGRDVTGSWAWEDGYFCRTLAWPGTDLPRDCQLVELSGSTLRFTAERGRGDTAMLRIR